MVGIKGKTKEAIFDLDIEPEVEKIATSTELDAKAQILMMKCKLLNSKKTMKFCRFLRLSDAIGFNLEDGFGEEPYSYYGRGLQYHECGISIQNPNDNDKSMWKCFIGVEGENGTTTIGAIISGSVQSNDSESQDDIEADDVFGLQHASVSLLCQRKFPTDYCWFRDPSGNKISVSDRIPTNSNDAYRYYGTGIQLGDCGLTIMNATHNDSGTWSCHMGSAHVTVIDKVEEISVRITETSLVSTLLFYDAQLGAPLSLDCKSVPAHVPLDYCRFVLPDGTGFSLNEKTTVHKPFMNKYYFNPNREMKSGFCSLVVKSIERSHFGQWTCAARLVASDVESFDEFRVIVFDNGVSLAGISGFSFGIAFSFGMMILLVYFVYQKLSVRRYARRRTCQTTVTYITSEDRVSISSGHSDHRLAQVEIT